MVDANENQTEANRRLEASSNLKKIYLQKLPIQEKEIIQPLNQ